MTKFIVETQISENGKTSEVVTIEHNGIVITIEESEEFNSIVLSESNISEEVKLCEIKQYLENKFSMGYWIADTIEGKLYSHFK